MSRMDYDEHLLREAARAARSAYAPYSGFRVGAAIRTRSGRVFSGCNVENASYGLTVCAERAAALQAVAAGHRQFAALAVVAGETEPAAPCGACLQVLAEFAAPSMPITLGSAGRPRLVVHTTLGDLLPRAFRLRPGSRSGAKR